MAFHCHQRFRLQNLSRLKQARASGAQSVPALPTDVGSQRNLLANTQHSATALDFTAQGGKARRKATHTRARRNMCGSRPAAGSRQASPQLPPAAQTGIGSPPAAATPDCSRCLGRASDGRTNSRRTHAKSRPGLTHSSRSAQTNRDSCHECELRVGSCGEVDLQMTTDPFGMTAGMSSPRCATRYRPQRCDVGTTLADDTFDTISCRARERESLKVKN